MSRIPRRPTSPQIARTSTPQFDGLGVRAGGAGKDLPTLLYQGLPFLVCLCVRRTFYTHDLSKMEEKKTSQSVQEEQVRVGQEEHVVPAHDTLASKITISPYMIVFSIAIAFS